jgi:hypothetical protein
MAYELGALTMRTALRLLFRSHGEPDGTPLILGPDITIVLGDPKGVVEQAL